MKIVVQDNEGCLLTSNTDFNVTYKRGIFIISSDQTIFKINSVCLIADIYKYKSDIMNFFAKVVASADINFDCDEDSKKAIEILCKTNQNLF